jgi:hypothetical protein
MNDVDGRNDSPIDQRFTDKPESMNPILPTMQAEHA